MHPHAKTARDLRTIVAGDHWRTDFENEPEGPQALEWAHRVLLNAADCFDRLAAAPSARKPFTGAERKQSGQMMQAKRDRQPEPKGSAPKRTHKAQLYRGY